MPATSSRCAPAAPLAALLGMLVLGLAACSGNDVRSQIVGTWERDVPTSGVHQRYSFSADSALAVEVRRPIGPGSTVRGSYAFADDSTVVLTYGTLAERFVAAVRDDTLVLRPQTGPTLLLARAAGSADTAR